MKISPEQAAALLETNFVNICKKLEAGATLTTAESNMLAKSAENFRPPPAGKASPLPAASTAAASFTLDTAAPLPAKLRGYYRKKLADYSAEYNRGERAIKRWVSCGRNAQPRPDLPPLDDPPAMAAWWRRMFPKESVPLEMLDHESCPQKNPGAAAEAAPAPDVDGEHEAPIFLNGSDIGSGESVRRSAASENVYFQLHQEALAAGLRDEARKWRTEYADAAELTNKLRRQHREQMKADGEWIPRGRVVAELAQMMEALRLAHGAMAQKIVADLERRTSGRKRRVMQLLAPEIAAAIEAVRAREADLLAGIESIRSPEAARDAFTLAA